MKKLVLVSMYKSDIVDYMRENDLAKEDVIMMCSITDMRGVRAKEVEVKVVGPTWYGFNEQEIVNFITSAEVFAKDDTPVEDTEVTTAGPETTITPDDDLPTEAPADDLKRETVEPVVEIPPIETAPEVEIKELDLPKDAVDGGSEPVETTVIDDTIPPAPEVKAELPPPASTDAEMAIDHSKPAAKKKAPAKKKATPKAKK